MSLRRTPLLAALLLVGCAPAERPGVQPEHLVLVTVEGLRADHVSALGYRRPTTTAESPQEDQALDLDWIAETGVLFADAQAASGEARASLASIHTGASPLVHGLVGDRPDLRADLPTLAEELRANGFRTTAFVSAHAELGGTGLERGFELFDERPNDDQAVTAFVADVVAASEDTRPCFRWLHLSGPRHPWSAAPVPDSPDARPAFAAGLPLGRIRPDEAGFAALRAGEPTPTDEERRALVALYDDELRRVDRLARLVFEALAAAGGEPGALSRSALVIVGASGVELGERAGAWRDDGGVHSESLHVPLVLRHPASLTGRRILAGVTDHLDLAPTLRELFGVRDPGAGGRSLLARTDSYREREFPARPSIAIVGRPGGGLSLSARVRDRRLVLEFQGEPRLYDLARDPSQRHDLAAELPEETRALCALVLERLLAQDAHPDLRGDGREYLLRTLHSVAETGGTD